MPDGPVIIEAAINGGNPDAPRSPAMRCDLHSRASMPGAAIVHKHIDMWRDAAGVAARVSRGLGTRSSRASRRDSLPTINASANRRPA